MNKNKQISGKPDTQPKVAVMKNNRNTEPANQKRAELTMEHDALVYEALQPLFERGAGYDITYRAMAHYLNTMTDIRTQRGKEFSGSSVMRILKRIDRLSR